MKPLLITMIVMCANLGHAQLAPFDKLKKMYDSATAPKSIAAAEASVAAMKSCAESNSQYPGEVLSNHKLVTLSYTTPSQGPEFPGVTTSLIAVTVGVVDSPTAENAMDSYRPVLTSQELQLDTKIYSSHTKCPKDPAPGLDDCWDSISTENVKLNIRLSAKYLLYQLGNDTYGYCWNQ